MSYLPVELPEGGWDRFMAEDWESRRRVFRSIVKKPAALSRMLFQAAAEAMRKSNPRAVNPPWRFMASRPSDRRVPPPLPRAADRSFLQYLTRAAKETRSRDVSFILNDAQAASAELFDTAADFLAGLSERAGTPLQTDAVVFATRSRVSALGIHRDVYSNFLFVVDGEKSFYLWPPDAVPGFPKEVPVAQLEELRATAEKVRLQAGDMLYMPSGYYHCAVQNGFSVHVSIVIAAGDQNATEMFLRGPLQELFRTSFTGEGGRFLALKPDEIVLDELPDYIATPLKNGLVANRRAEEVMRDAFLRTQSASGFSVSPPERAAMPLKPADRVIARRSNLHLMTAGGTLIVGACGQVLHVPAHPLLLEMLQTLRSGEPVTVRQLLRRFTGTARIGEDDVALDNEWILFFLGSLQQAGWLRIDG
jgi:hypothetical protein